MVTDLQQDSWPRMLVVFPVLTGRTVTQQRQEQAAVHHAVSQ